SSARSGVILCLHNDRFKGDLVMHHLPSVFALSKFSAIFPFEVCNYPAHTSVLHKRCCTPARSFFIVLHKQASHSVLQGSRLKYIR
ncbi:MAG: hypothetical protein KDD04_09745, partial [Sinomicrobium sp.]|nr:hypothetical protein [Sinomicrobium sp.]